MKISVLISVYKAEKPQYLERALKSVWDDQTYKPSEIILIADGELTPELDNIIETWKDSLGESFVFIKNETNYEPVTKFKVYFYEKIRFSSHYAYGNLCECNCTVGVFNQRSRYSSLHGKTFYIRPI